MLVTISYLVILVWAIGATFMFVLLARKHNREIAAAQDLINKMAQQQVEGKKWAQKLIEHSDAEVKKAMNDGFNAGRQDMLDEFKERVDNGEINITVNSVPKKIVVQ